MVSFKRVFASAVVFALGVALSACSSGGGNDGNCSIEEASSIGPDGWTWSTNNYCGTQDQCHQYCNAAAGHDAVKNCKWDSTPLCSGSIPSAAPDVCAASLNVTCSGTPGTPTVNCTSCDSVTPGKSDYDPSTDCLSQWGSSVGRAATCSDAMAQIQ